MSKVVPGWSQEVRPYQVEARYWHDAWRKEGYPRGNWLHNLMIKKRAQYHYAVRRVRRNSDKIRALNLFEASLAGDVRLLAEMKKIRCKGGISNYEQPDEVDGAQGETEIAENFK